MGLCPALSRRGVPRLGRFGAPRTTREWALGCGTGEPRRLARYNPKRCFYFFYFFYFFYSYFFYSSYSDIDLLQKRDRQRESTSIAAVMTHLAPLTPGPEANSCPHLSQCPCIQWAARLGSPGSHHSIHTPLRRKQMGNSSPMSLSIPRCKLRLLEESFG